MIVESYLHSDIGHVGLTLIQEFAGCMNPQFHDELARRCLERFLKSALQDAHGNTRQLSHGRDGDVPAKVFF